MKFDKPMVLPKNIHEIMHLYPFENVVAIEKLGGIPNTTFKVVTSQRKIAVRIYSHGQSSLEHIELELKILQHLENLNFPSPRILAGNNGKYLQYWRGYPVCATKFIYGVMADTLSFSSGLIGDVGRVVAHFQKAMSSFSVDTELEGETFIKKGLDALESLPSALKSKGWDMNIQNIISHWNRACSPFIDSTLTFKSHIIHADIWPPNVICKNGRVKALVDFDDWSYGPIFFDVALALMEFAMWEDVVLNNEMATAFFTNYFRNGGILSNLEEELIINVMEMACAVWLSYEAIQSTTSKRADLYHRRLNLMFDTERRIKISENIKNIIQISREEK